MGAHKGYFGAFAFGSGASAVVSYEPATQNYLALERAASRIAPRWSTRHAAVGGERGEGTLFLDRTSWAHSLVSAKRPAGEETVSIVTLADALGELPSQSRIVVKIDAEGSEYAILAGTSVLERVDCLLVEWHASTASCTIEELVRVVEVLRPRARRKIRSRASIPIASKTRALAALDLAQRSFTARAAIVTSYRGSWTSSSARLRSHVPRPNRNAVAERTFPYVSTSTFPSPNASSVSRRAE